MYLVMINGIQAVTARITQLEQKFMPTTDTASVPSNAATASSSDFATVLAAALGSDSNALALGGTTGSGGAAATALTSLVANPAALTGLLAQISGSGGASTPSGTAGVGAIAAGTPTPAVRRDPGSYGKLTPPPELAAYGNGRIPTDQLQSIGVGSHKLYAPAAQAYQQMTADAAAQGVNIGITDSYRTYDSQVELAGRKGLYSQGGLAATPGTSNHGWGLAVDLNLNSTAQQWMRDNGPKYGFVEDTPREAWHWSYRPGAV